MSVLSGRTLPHGRITKDPAEEISKRLLGTFNRPSLLVRQPFSLGWTDTNIAY